MVFDAALTLFQILCNCRSLPHADVHNYLDEPSLLVALSDFRGGELWVQSTDGDHELAVGGKNLKGRLIDLQRGPAFFDAHRLHATMPWRGRRMVLVAFTVRNPEKLQEEHVRFLESVGFRPPRPSEALPDSPSAPGEDFPLRAVGFPLSGDKLRERFELPSSGVPPGHFAPSHERASGSLRVEPRVSASGSLGSSCRGQPSLFCLHCAPSRPRLGLTLLVLDFLCLSWTFSSSCLPPLHLLRRLR